MDKHSKLMVSVTATMQEYRDLLKDLEDNELSHEHGNIYDQISRQLKHAGQRRLDEFIGGPPPSPRGSM